MKIFITMPHAPIPDSFFTPEIMEELGRSGEVRRNPYDRDLTAEELIDMAGDAEILMTGWGTCYLEKEIVAALPKLRLIAHTAGSVAILASPEFMKPASGSSAEMIFLRSPSRKGVCVIPLPPFGESSTIPAKYERADGLRAALKTRG